VITSGVAISDRRDREQAARRQLIVGTARRLAEAEGWDAVTTRRLSNEIEYSQPVLYKHFAGMEQIADAVALDGYAEIADAIAAASSAGDASADVALGRIAMAYLNFARNHPAVYEAMFTRSTALRYAASDTPPQLSAAFDALHRAVVDAGGDRESDTLTEVFWAALHGLVSLDASGRLRPDHVSDRVRLLVERFTTV
jgi:AcrR family transcriptional regulator